MSTSRSSDGGGPAAERGQAFLHRARDLRGLAPHQIARIARRLEEPRPRRPRRVVARALAAAALVLTAGTAVAWASGALERLPGLGALFGRAHRLPHAAPVLPPTVQPGAPSTAAAVPERTGSTADSEGVVAPPASGGAPEPASPAPALETAPLPRARAHHRKATVASAQAPAETADMPIVLEGRSFAHVLELWRARRDGPAALAALDEHEHRFAGGQMRAEAQMLRAEILLAAHRDREALAALDRVTLDRVPRARELHALRGELRARFGRCDEARADLAPLAGAADAAGLRAREALARCP